MNCVPVMGNMLESDSSTASDSENRVQGEMRTDGDGMESDIVDSPAKIGAESFPVELPIQKLTSSSFSGCPKGSIKLSNSSGSIDEGSSFPLDSVKAIRRTKEQVISPRQLPPRDKLIPLKPAKSSHDLGSVTGAVANSSYVQFTSAPLGKQKNPKFIPYEPYSGATRSMVDDDSSVNCDISHRPSSSNSSSNSRTAASPADNTMKTTPSHLEDGVSKSKAASFHPGDFFNNTANHSTTLLKERLKMAEKDIQEIQMENARLKKLLVDSLSGAGSHEIKCASMNCKPDTSGNTHSITESFDNLSDEIEVWRSKFLSSCVLVEQLTKEKQNMQEMVSNAVEILREIKNTTSLTPEAFHQVNQWLAHTSSLSTFQSYDENLDTEEENSISV